MKPIQKNELFRHLNGFLKSRGVELTDGSYSQGVRRGCDLLTDVVNFSQKGLKHARTEIDKNLDKMRQTIHEKTAPKKAAAPKSRKPAAKAKAKSKAR